MSIREALRRCRDALADGGFESPDFEAQCLTEHVTGYSRAQQLAHSDEPLNGEAARLLDALLQKRLRHYPLQYLLQSWSFMGFPLTVGEGVLIPRDDTEVVAGLCLDFLKDKPRAQVLDLCAGSGAISVALARLARAQVTAVEWSEQAFYFLEKNISDNHAEVKPVRGDIFVCHRDFADGAYDLIVSNPPYIKTAELPELQPEVQFEPRLALDGGESGYDFYEAIVRDWSHMLKRGGALAFELGEGQAETVGRLMAAQGFGSLRTERDLGGEQRAIIGTMLRV